jgi:NADH-quinone oxidoreductase subunit H
MIIMTPAMTVFAVVPFGPGAAGANPYQIASVDIGVLFILALSSLGVYGIAIGGWASFSKWSLFGGLRASAQMISYEVALGLSITGVLILTGSFDLVAIVNQQIESPLIFGFLPAWNAITQGGGFIVFLVAVFAETNRLPFDMAEAEQELVGGYHTEYSSMKFAMFFLAEYANMVVASALVTLLFLGGWHFPGLDLLGLPPFLEAFGQIFILMFKMFLIIFLFIWARWTFPRFRYDQLMKLGWLVLLPVALGNLILTAIWVAIF